MTANCRGRFAPLPPSTVVTGDARNAAHHCHEGQPCVTNVCTGSRGRLRHPATCGRSSFVGPSSAAHRTMESLFVARATNQECTRGPASLASLICIVMQSADGIGGPGVDGAAHDFSCARFNLWLGDGFRQTDKHSFGCFVRSFFASEESLCRSDNRAHDLPIVGHRNQQVRDV